MRENATRRGTVDEISRFNDWFCELPHPHKVFVAGNHDFLFETDPPLARSLLDPDIHYLEDTGVELEELKIWGSPWQPVFFNWAFNLPRGAPLREKWALIPDDTDVLITHGPPHLIGDRTARGVHAGWRRPAGRSHKPYSSRRARVRTHPRGLRPRRPRRPALPQRLELRPALPAGAPAPRPGSLVLAPPAVAADRRLRRFCPGL